MCECEREREVSEDGVDEGKEVQKEESSNLIMIGQKNVTTDKQKMNQVYKKSRKLTNEKDFCLLLT